MSENKNNEYDTSSIKVLHGLEAVRKRPGMYIGDTDDGSGLHHMVFEAVDNSIDEALAGFCDHIEVTIHEDGSVSCTDNGRGIPVAMHPEEKVSAAEVAMTVLHAGGKFDSNSYKVSGGLHGVGISVVNALSDKLELTIRREDHIWRQVYLDGGRPEAPLHQIGDSDEHGTSVRFWPSPEVFNNNITFEYSLLAKRLRELSFLNSGIKITLTDLRETPAKSEVFHHEKNEGISAFINYLNKGKKTIQDQIIHFTNENDENKVDNISVEISMQWTDAYTENIYCFTNNVPQKDGGQHLAGFKRAITNTFNTYLSEQATVDKKLKDVTVSPEDIREGLTAVVSVKMPDPKFSSQTKDKLVSSEAGTAVNNCISSHLLDILIFNKKVFSDAICTKILSAAVTREAVRKVRDLSRGGKSGISSKTVDKLFPCREKNPALSEIFLVEGDSAGGSAKNGRDSKFQAVLPLRGKILNVEKARLDKVLESEQISNLVVSFGCGIGENYDVEKIRYHNIIIMTDADVDGAHIRILLLTFFYHFFPGIIENGYVFVAEPPLYKYEKKSTSKNPVYVITEEDASFYEVSLAVEMGQLFPTRGGGAIPAVSLEALFKKYIEVVNVAKKACKQEADYNFEAILNLLYYKLITEETFASEANAMEWAEGFIKILPSNPSEGMYYKCSVEHDALNNKFFPVIIKHVYGTDECCVFNEKLLTKIRYDKFKSLHSKIYDLIEDDGYLYIPSNPVDNKEIPVKTITEVYDILRKKAKDSVNISRYKGLGEMSSEQLSETAMNPDTRGIKRVQIGDAIEASKLFADLMGDDVPVRKEYIDAHCDEAVLDV